MKKETKYQKLGVGKQILMMILIYILIQLVLFICKLYVHPLIYVILSPISSIFFACSLFVLSGALKGKIVVNNKNKYFKKINPYIYFRELPNFFGIGVTTLLMDSTIENEKDIVAAILDLCAKKYLRLEKQGDKYIIKILKNVDSSLLSNEKYILSLISNNNVKNIDYEEWFDYCMQDGIDLGLYTHTFYENEVNYSSINKTKDLQGFEPKILLIFTPLFFVFLFYISDSLKTAILSSLILVFGCLIALLFNFLFDKMMEFAEYYKNQNYVEQLNNSLIRTDKGTDELHKLYSFKAFIKDFGNFAKRKPEEVILWDRYLSYAQVFGLTKEIMATGYKELVDNSSFCIDSIDNINLYNIEVK